MFKKLLSNLAFNPSLIGQVSFYAKRMHQEAVIRRMGVIMLALGLFVQTFAALAPPEPTLANSNNDLIVGGFKTVKGAVDACNSNTRNYKTILSHYNISCSDVAKSSTINLKSTDHNKQLYSMGYLSQGPIIERTGKKTGETPVTIPGVGTLYLRYLWAWDSGAYSNYEALKINKDGKTFYILYDCGNLVTVGIPPVTTTTSTPTPTPKPDFTVEKGVNTKGVTSYYLQEVTVKPGDQVEFSIEIMNTGNVTLNKVIVKDVLPAGMKAVNGSLAVDGKKVSALLSGFDAGKMDPRVFRRVTFSAIVDKTVDACGTKRLKNIATVTPDSLPAKQDGANVQACQPKETPTPITPTPIATPVPAPVTPQQPVITPCPYNSSLSKDDAACKPCEASQTRDDKTSCLEYRKSVRNVTQNIADANGTTAKANDVVEYTLSVKNKGTDKVTDFIILENISDVLDYANVVSIDGGKLDSMGEITWPKQDIAGGATIQKQIIVKIKDPIPQTPISASDPGRFDLTMVNTYGNTTSVKLPATVIKTAEIQTTKLPNTGPGESVAAVIALTIFVSYFFARARLVAKELDVVRSDFSSSGGY